MALETVAFQQTEQLEANAQITNDTASNVGRRVFELLARPLEAHGPNLANMTWTMTPTIWATGYPPHQTVDQDREPETVLDH